MISLKGLGTSMYPLIREGDILLVKECSGRVYSANEINPGEILLYEISGKFFVHRLIWKTRNTYLMKADTHFYFERIEKFQIRGKVKAVVRDGRIIDLTTPLNNILSFLLGFCLLPVSFVYDFVCSSRIYKCSAGL